MKKFLFIFLISCFSLTVISCGDEPFFEWDNSTPTTTSDDTTTTTDTTAPVIAEVTKVTTPTNDNTPNYTFSSTEAGTITYGGSCSSGTTSATTDNNTITLVSLSDGTYSDCTITVTDSAGNVSNSLTITSFTVDTTTTRIYYDLNAITFGNNTFVAVGESGIVRTSSDNGSSWDNGTSETTRQLNEIAYGNSTFVAVGQSGTHLYSSDNGSTWST